MLALEAQARLGALDLDVALDAGPGRCLALSGPSGAGKTTILRVAAGLLRPDTGWDTCGEETWLDTARGIDVAPERRRCGYVFQDYALFPHLRAWQNVAYGLRGGGDGLGRAARRARAHELLERLGLAGRADARPHTLSGGERQRVALARALAPAPAALLLDEPLSALDARTRAAAGRELSRVLRDTGVPSLLVTHDFTEAALLGDEVGIVDGGRIVQRGTAGDLAGSPASAFVADFTGAVVLTGRVNGSDRGLTLIALHGGGTVASVEAGSGEVAVALYPWEIALEPPHAVGAGSAQNRLDVEVVAVTPVGNRVRVGLAAPQPLVAELSAPAVAALGLAPGARATATFKAAATRVLAL